MRDDRSEQRRRRPRSRRVDDRRRDHVGRRGRASHHRLAALFAALGLALTVVLAVSMESGSDPGTSERDTSVREAARTREPTQTPGGEDERPAAPNGPVVRIDVGRGARGAVILRRADATGARPTTIFLHGWGIRDPDAYGPWLRHLAAQGETVIFPRYQRRDLGSPARALDRAVAGIRRALRRASVADDGLVVAGHSAGAALAADYAAAATRRGLPPAAGVYAVFPGRAILGYPAGIPAVGGRKIPPKTLLLVMAGTRDTVVGELPARELLESASRVQRKSLVVVSRPGVADHYAPTRSGRSVRRTFWKRLDRFIARARGTATDDRP